MSGTTTTTVHRAVCPGDKSRHSSTAWSLMMRCRRHKCCMPA